MPQRNIASASAKRSVMSGFKITAFIFPMIGLTAASIVEKIKGQYSEDFVALYIPHGLNAFGILPGLSALFVAVKPKVPRSMFTNPHAESMTKRPIRP